MNLFDALSPSPVTFGRARSQDGWEIHVLKSGRRRGQTVEKNERTGAIRDLTQAVEPSTPSNPRPYNAGGHLRSATDGPPELVELLQKIHEPDARLIAADFMTDLGRDEEAEMLRDPQHPLVAIKGGVFYAPGIKSQLTPRSILVAPSSARPHSAALDYVLNAGGITHTGSDTRIVRKGRGTERDHPSHAALSAIMRHQMKAEEGEHYAVPAADAGRFIDHIEKETDKADKYSDTVHWPGRLVFGGGGPSHLIRTDLSGTPPAPAGTSQNQRWEDHPIQKIVRAAGDTPAYANFPQPAYINDIGPYLSPVMTDAPNTYDEFKRLLESGRLFGTAGPAGTAIDPSFQNLSIYDVQHHGWRVMSGPSAIADLFAHHFARAPVYIAPSKRHADHYRRTGRID